jgi:hypothetical protein
VPRKPQSLTEARGAMWKGMTLPGIPVLPACRVPAPYYDGTGPARFRAGGRRIRGMVPEEEKDGREEDW